MVDDNDVDRRVRRVRRGASRRGAHLPSLAASPRRARRGRARSTSRAPLAGRPGSGRLPAAWQAGSPLDTLIAAAKKEGTINTIALPPDWANYGEIMKHVQEQVQAQADQRDPGRHLGAGERRDRPRRRARSARPTCVDVGPSFARSPARQARSTRRTRSRTGRRSRPTSRMPTGYWVGDYWGVIAFGTNVASRKTAPRTGPTSRTRLQEHGRDRRRPAPGRRGVRRRLRRVARQRRLARRHHARHPVLRRAQDGGQLHHRRRPPRRPRRAARRRSWRAGTTCSSPTATTSRARSTSPSPFRRPASIGGFYCQAHQRPRAAPERRQALAGVPLLRRGPAALAQGLHAPGALPGPGQAQVIPASLLAKLPPAQDYKTVKFPSLAQTAKCDDKLLAAQWGPKVAGAVALSATTTRRGRASAASRSPRAPARVRCRSHGSAPCRSSSTPCCSCCSRPAT